MSIKSTLKQRGKRYGKFEDHSAISQDLKATMQATPGWQNLSAAQKEGLEMIQHKVARVLNGDPNYKDNWHDISGYATLVEDLCDD